MRRELPGRVRGELEVRIERALIPVEESLKQQLVGIVQDLQVTLFEEFKQSYRHGDPIRTSGCEMAVSIAAAVVPDDASQTVYNPLVQDDKGKGKDAIVPGPDNYVVETSNMDNVWSVSQPMGIALPSYPFIVDDTAAFLDSVTQEDGNWDSRWTNGAYSSWM